MNNVSDAKHTNVEVKDAVSLTKVVFSPVDINVVPAGATGELVFASTGFTHHLCIGIGPGLTGKDGWSPVKSGPEQAYLGLTF